MRCAKPLAALVALLLLPYPLLSQPADSPWPMFGHDASHTGRGQTAGPAAPTLLWSYRGLLAGSPSIGPAGEIYTRGFSLNDLACLDSAGMLLWTYRCRADVSPWTGAAVAMDGRVHFGSADNNLYCIGSDGALSWSYRTSAPAYTYPSIDSAGRVYFGGWAGRLYCLSSDGSLEWSAVSGGSQYTSPSVGPDGRVYLMLSLNEVRCIYPGGGLAWTFLVSTWASSSSPAVESSGSIYFGTSAPDYHLYRLGSDGSLEWSYDTFTEASPAIGRYTRARIIRIFTRLRRSAPLHGATVREGASTILPPPWIRTAQSTSGDMRTGSMPLPPPDRSHGAVRRTISSRIPYWVRKGGSISPTGGLASCSPRLLQSLPLPLPLPLPRAFRRPRRPRRRRRRTAASCS